MAFHGRRDRQVKVRGFRMDLYEVERAVQECLGVNQFYLHVKVYGEDTALALFVTPETPGQLEPESLRGELLGRLPLFMVPDRILVLASLPQTPNGKVDRQRLAEMIEENAASPSSVAARRR